ncbi:sterol desaturase family protein [Labedaea rhizosphaerae]|uniref:Fatty acid hydroxylase family protein n=1 Tax=Labedaea rhizosphaerae TaxID=598644 RepID=A0A4R6SH55_LABRH|nr:sterol desaturase family protein [Labedaea rhizosphaerae]TDQ00860.1 fatty acid hydroxylase family protein [Labedaea rhizosphaerae]
MTERRPKVTLAEAARVFRRQPSPWMIGALLVAAIVARIVLADWRLGDLVLVGVMIAVFPLAEWVIHVCVLHWRPRRIGRVKIDSLLARKHREHHADPRDVPLVFIPWQTLLWLLPVVTAIGLLAFPTLARGLTFLVVLGLLGLGYEWTHHLIHTDYKPRTRLFRAVWRNHRLHHFKNEHYWFTVTTTGTADRVLGTYPDPSTVANSPTAKALHDYA